jgi:hypothetical protein
MTTNPDLVLLDDERYDTSFADVLTTAIKTFGVIDNAATGEGTSMDAQTFAKIRGPAFLARGQIRGLLANSWIAQKAVSKAPQHAMKAGYKAVFNDKALEQDIKAEFTALDAAARLLDGLCAARAFGGAVLLCLVEDEFRTSTNEFDPSRPLRDEDGNFLPGVHRLAGLYMIEGGRDCSLHPADRAPEWAYDELPEGAPPPALVEWRPGRHFAKPIWWTWDPQTEYNADDEPNKPSVNGGPVVIHRDRLIFLESGVYTDRETRQLNGGWALGIFDAAAAPIMRFESSQSTLYNIIQDFFTTVGKVKDFKKIIAAGEISKLIARFKTNAIAKSVLHMYLCDADDEEITMEGAPVSGLNELIDKQMDTVAGATHTARSILFNEAPRSGGKDEAGRESWNEDCEAIRAFSVLPALYDIIDLIKVSKRRPAEIREYTLGFPPLQRPSIEAAATAYRTYAHGDEINVKAGLITRKEARSRQLSVDGLSEMVVEDVEPPPEEEFLALAQAVDPGRQRNSGENTESKGKRPNSAAKR